MALKLREIHIRTRPAFQQLSRITIKVDPEVEDRGGDGMPVHKNMILDQMQAARTHHQRRGRFTEQVLLSFEADELDGAVHCGTEVNLSLNHILLCMLR